MLFFLETVLVTNMVIIEIILSKKLNHDIADIIMTYLWKERFKSVIKEVKGIKHFFMKKMDTIFV